MAKLILLLDADDTYLCAKIVLDALSWVNVILMSLYKGLLKKSATKRFSQVS